jgi:hypothetical protein
MGNEYSGDWHCSSCVLQMYTAAEHLATATAVKAGLTSQKRDQVCASSSSSSVLYSPCCTHHAVPTMLYSHIILYSHTIL